ncbi:hypothetical protein JZ751_012971, partial [Albula glossodonta]
AAESGIVKIKTIAARNTDILAAISQCGPRGLCFLGLAKEPRLPALRRRAPIPPLIKDGQLNSRAPGSIITMLWQLMEKERLEELKLLQTVLAIVLCFRLHFTKDNITNNTAAATVRQVVTVVFERMVAEDERYKGIVEQPPAVQGNSNRRSISTLRPSAKDAYMLFQVPPKTPAPVPLDDDVTQDLCQLVNADAPYWLVGMTEMTRTFGLELLESVLNDFPGVFLQHQEFSFLLKERVCPLVIKLFSPNIKFRQGMAAPSPAPVTECEIFLSLLVKSFCQSYDMKPHSTKVFRDIVNALGSFVQSLFIVPSLEAFLLHVKCRGTHPGLIPITPWVGQDLRGSGSGGQAASQSGPGAAGAGGGLTTQAAFEYRGTWIPLMTVSVQGSAKATYLEMLDKVEPPSIPEGYAMSVAFSALLDLHGRDGHREHPEGGTNNGVTLWAAGPVLGTSWQLVLATLQHLVWILGLKPGSGGALKPGRAVEGPSTEPSLFAVAKLLETGLVNMDRIEILWRPLTGHLLEVRNGQRRSHYCLTTDCITAM